MDIMKFIPTSLNGVFIIEAQRLSDERGWFSRLFCKEELKTIGSFNISQINQSFNSKKGTLRGMHYQNMPHAESKIVQCLQGCVQDVIVDLRKNSATFLKYFSVVLSGSDSKMVYIPKGCAHGFLAMEDNSMLLYFHDTPYTPGFEGGIKWDDPKVNVKWKFKPLFMSEKDLNREYLGETFSGINI